MPFTEFCCRSGGSNLNAGTRKGDSTEPGTSASFTYASGTWVASTGVFTVASGNPSTDGIVAGDFASVYADGSTVTGFVGRVTAVSSTTITVSLAVMCGTPPANGTSNRTLKIGGAWKGPNAAEQFPFNFFQTLTNVAGNPARINFKNDANYSITATLAHTLIGGPTIWQGYTTSYADGGKAIIDGGTTGASYNLVAPVGAGGAYHTYIDFIFQNNGATGNAEGGVFADFRTKVWRCVVRNVRGTGFSVAQALECEAYACNQSNTFTRAGFTAVANSDRYTRCISHDNVGSNNCGFYSQSGASYYYDCIADSNGSHGFFFNNEADSVVLHNCDVYNNGGDGFNSISGGQDTLIENCNFVNNAGIGINIASGAPFGQLINNGFGSGTQANVGGDKVGTGILIEIGSVIYPANVTPWVDPANGDFRINLVQAKGAGRGSFTQVAAGYGGTVAYPDIGAAQSNASAASAGGYPASRLQLGH